MTSVLFEIALIFVLLICNGLFAMAEIAIISSRRAKLQAMADAGDRGAARALALAEAPDRLLSTMRIGITLAGVLASMIGGARLAGRLAVVLGSVSWLGSFATEIAFGIVIVALAFFSLVIGELLPRRLAAHFPEGIASFLSKPVDWLGRLASPLVHLLSGVTGGILRLCGTPQLAAAKISKEELAGMIREGVVSGTIEQGESKMMEGVLAFEKLDVYDVMIPRPKIVWIDIEAKHETSWPKIVRSSQRYFPVYQKDRDNLVGVVSLKDCYAQLAADIPVSFKHLMRPPQCIPETQKASATLEMFRTTGIHVAFVMDEFGGVSGMVTLIGLMEAILGQVPSAEQRRALTIQRRHDGSWLIDGLFELDELPDHLTDFQVPASGSDETRTIAGFFSAKLGRVPAERECVREGGWIFEIVDMDGIRIDKVIARVDPAVPKPAAVENREEIPIAAR